MAQKFNYPSWIITIFTPIILNLQWVKDILDSYYYIAIIFFPIITLTINKKIEIYTNIGASCKQYVDYHLFNFKLPSKYGEYDDDSINMYATKVKQKHPKYYKKQISNTGTNKIKGVKDWYTSINENMTEENAIFMCQKENFNFDNMLTSQTNKLLKLIVLSLLIISILLNLNNTVLNLLIILSTLISAFIKAIDLYNNTNKLHNYNIIAREYFNSKKYTAIELQKIIDERRKIPFIVPNYIHKIFSVKIHEIIKSQSKVL